jgi:uncharacterized protein YhhL (DUF1145 family)
MFTDECHRDTMRMVKRIASASLWFVATVWGFSFVNLMIEAPPALGIVIAVAASAFVAIDPLHLFWPVRAAAVVAPTRAAAPAPGAMQTQV